MERYSQYLSIFVGHKADTLGSPNMARRESDGRHVRLAGLTSWGLIEVYIHSLQLQVWVAIVWACGVNSVLICTHNLNAQSFAQQSYICLLTWKRLCPLERRVSGLSCYIASARMRGSGFSVDPKLSSPLLCTVLFLGLSFKLWNVRYRSFVIHCAASEDKTKVPFSSPIDFSFDSSMLITEGRERPHRTLPPRTWLRFGYHTARNNRNVRAGGQNFENSEQLDGRDGKRALPGLPGCERSHASWSDWMDSDLEPRAEKGHNRRVWRSSRGWILEVNRYYNFDPRIQISPACSSSILFRPL